MSDRAAIDILQWYVAMGVDIAVDETPHDRFAEGPGEEAPPAADPRPALNRSNDADSGAPTPIKRGLTTPAPTFSANPANPANAALATEQAAAAARTLAQSAKTIEELKAALEEFDGCGLKRTASQTVFADGNPQARIMFVGEAPGADEDRRGMPFVGPAGVILDRMLAAIGLDRQNAYITNVVPWRPPGNRTPSSQEIAICLPFLQRHIALVNPDIIVCLGAVPVQTLLGIKEGVTRVRGRWFDLEIENGRKVPTLATLHPGFLLHSPGQKKLVWKDLRELAKKLKALGDRPAGE